MGDLRELTKEELKKYSESGYLTVGILKEFLNTHKLADDSIVVVQRIENVYYEENGWGVYLKEGENTYYAKQWNKDIKSGKYLDKEQYPDIKLKDLKLHTNEEIKEGMEQYHPVWSCVKYKDDEDILFLDLHY